MNSIVLPTIPTTLRWENAPAEWRIEQAESLSITAGKRTDLFSDPQGTSVMNNSPRLLFTPPGNFVLSAKVTVEFAATFDAGVLLLYENQSSWAKLCFEYSPQKQPMIVSVVTRGYSDDCNSVCIDGNQIYLRIAKLDQAFAFHYSEDGHFWHLIRYFALGQTESVAVGFSSQSPMGERCTAVFSEISYAATKLTDIRSGI